MTFILGFHKTNKSQFASNTKKTKKTKKYREVYNPAN